MFQNLKGKKVLVMGLGIAGGGLSVVKWLLKQGATITITDLRTKKELMPTLKKIKNLRPQNLGMRPQNRRILQSQNLRIVQPQNLRTGLQRLRARRVLSFSGCRIQSLRNPLSFSGCRYVLGLHRAKDFKNADLIIKNPAVPPDSPYLKIAKKYHVPIASDIEIFFQRWPGKNIALTGTKGKSTTVNLIYHILQQARKPCYLGGNVGQTPLLFLPHAKSHHLAILELSSFQLEDLKIKPDISIITNLFPDHLNRHKTIKKYVLAKTNIFKHQSAKQYTILNYDNKSVRQLASQIKAKLIFFSTKTTVCPAACQMLFCLKNNQLALVKPTSSCYFGSLNKIKLKGQHNLENILAATAAVYLCQIKPTIIIKAINNFTAIPHRLELIRVTGGVKYYNDTTATNPGATSVALDALAKDKNIILIAGGADKNLNFRGLVPKIKKTCRQVLLLTGTATPKLKQTLQKIKYPGQNILEFNNLSAAVKTAKEIARAGEVVLLSPACASFGLFANEFDRGKQFIRLVKKL